MKFIQNLINRLFNSWQTSLIGVIVCVITVMYYMGKIDTQEWIIAIGGIATLMGFLMKDPDKTQNKNGGQP